MLYSLQEHRSSFFLRSLSHTSLVHGQCSDRPLVNFPAAEHCQLICSHFPPTEDRRLSWPGWLVTCWCSVSDVSRTKTWGQQHWVVYLHMGTLLVVSMLDLEWLRWCDPTPWPPGQTATYWGASYPGHQLDECWMLLLIGWLFSRWVSCAEQWIDHCVTWHGTMFIVGLLEFDCPQNWGLCALYQFLLLPRCAYFAVLAPWWHFRLQRIVLTVSWE